MAEASGSHEGLKVSRSGPEPLIQEQWPLPVPDRTPGPRLGRPSPESVSSSSSNAMGFIDKSLQIQLNVPRVWAQSEGYLKGKKVLVEPFIHNWQKFNSNSCEGEDDYTSHAKHHRVKRCAAGAASLLLSTPCRARALTSTHAYTLPISRSASIVIRRVVIRRVFFVNGTQRSSRTARRYVAR